VKIRLCEVAVKVLLGEKLVDTPHPAFEDPEIASMVLV
jgi:hypothetical protein